MLLDTFKDTIFLKESSSLNKRLNALEKLLKEYPNNKKIKDELYAVKKGIRGEKEIRYQLSKANIGMYVLRDINLKYENLNAQIDYIVVTRYCCYFIECKNLYGNIIINDKGDFLREFNFDGKKVLKGMESPLTQVENQRNVYKKLWNTRLSSNKVLNFIRRFINESNFTSIHKVLVCAANDETIINTKYAPKDIKDKVVRADALIRRIESDLKVSDKSLWASKKSTEDWAKTFLNVNVADNTDYYHYYKNKLVLDSQEESKKELLNLKERLTLFRKERSKQMNIPAYYIFTNEELDKIIETMPKTIEELKQILPQVKINVHGKVIIDYINKNQ